MSVSYNYDRSQHMGQPKHTDSSSSYDQGYNSNLPRNYSNSVTSDGFSDISLDPYNTRQGAPYYHPGYTNSPGYNNSVFTPDDGSRRQIMGVQHMPLNDSQSRQRDSSTDSYYNSRGPPSVISSVGREADVESISSRRTNATTASYASQSTTSTYDQYRYNGELYRPVAAPRKVNEQVKKLFGEIHPRMLRPDEKPIIESGEETDDTYSIDSFATPTPAPRASMRLKKSQSISFIEDEQMKIDRQSLTSILRSPSTPSRLDSYGKKMVVRFEYVDKQAAHRPKRDMTDYSDIDSDREGSRKGSKKKKQDIWSHVGPVGPKPARNSMRDSKRSSSGRQRSSSASRSKQSSSSGSRQRSNSTSSTSRKAQQSPALSRKDSSKHAQTNGNGEHKAEKPRNTSTAEDGQVSIVMPEKTVKKSQNSMIGDIRQSNNESGGLFQDTQKVCKWALIIGVPTVLLVIVIVVVAVVFSQN